MDNLCHTLAGFALAACARRPAPAVIATVVLASNIPDLDCISLLWGKPAYLIYHRHITHSFIGVAVSALLLASMVRACAPPASLASLTAWALLGGLLHVGMDAMNSYGVRPFLPFDERWVYGDAIFIVDPWLWLLLGASASFVFRERRWTRAAWGGLALGLTALIATNERVPSGAAGVWCALLAGVLAAHLLLRTAPARKTAARAMAALALVYCGTLFAISHEARTRGLESLAKEQIAVRTEEDASVFPGIVVPWKPMLLAETEEAFHWRRFDLGTGEVTATREPRPPAPPFSERARATPEYRAWRIFARHPVAILDGERIILDDMRYRRGATHGWSQLELPLAPAE